MPNHKNIFRNKRDFAREEFATELYTTHSGIPRARERRSQAGQQPLNSMTHKSIKRKMNEKLGAVETRH